MNTDFQDFKNKELTEQIIKIFKSDRYRGRVIA